MNSMKNVATRIFSIQVDENVVDVIVEIVETFELFAEISNEEWAYRRFFLVVFDVNVNNVNQMAGNRDARVEKINNLEKYVYCRSFVVVI